MTEITASQAQAALAAKNRRLGLTLAGIAVAILAWAMIRFTLAGLPADKELTEDQQQAATAEAAADVNLDIDAALTAGEPNAASDEQSVQPTIDASTAE